MLGKRLSVLHGEGKPEALRLLQVRFDRLQYANLGLLAEPVQVADAAFARRFA